LNLSTLNAQPPLDICHGLEEILIEEYANEKPYSEGHIYYRLRCASSAADTDSELRWTARLSSNSQMRLKSFLNVSDLRNALDLVMLMPGQRPALRISMFHRIQAIKCNEVRGLLFIAPIASAKSNFRNYVDI
jgi:hypothetical protein